MFDCDKKEKGRALDELVNVEAGTQVRGLFYHCEIHTASLLIAFINQAPPEPAKLANNR